MPLGRAIPVGDVARLGVFFVALGLAATRSQFAHIPLTIAFEGGLAAPGGDRDQVNAAVGVAQRPAASCAREQTKEIVLGEVLGIDRQIHRRCSCGE